FEIAARASGEGPFKVSVTGRLRLEAERAQPPVPVAALRAGARATVEGERFYQAGAVSGLEFGPSVRGLQQLWHDAEGALAELAAPPAVVAEAGRYCIHPALLDAALQAAGAALLGDQSLEEGDAIVPDSVGALRLSGDPGQARYSRVV